MPATSTLLHESDSGVLTLTLNRPDKLNAIHNPLAEALLDALHAAATDPAVRAIRLRGNGRMQAALAGINAAVVGLLLAALYQPVWTGAIRGAGDFALALLALLALMFWKLPPWLVVAGSGLLGWALSFV